jgi:hypothetical protein
MSKLCGLQISENASDGTLLLSIIAVQTHVLLLWIAKTYGMNIAPDLEMIGLVECGLF